MEWLSTLLYGAVLVVFLHLCRKMKAENRKRAVKQAAEDRKFKVCVIGAGFSGIGIGYTLNDMGIDYDIFEKNDDVGGTWYDNIYPGVGCDVQSHLYSFSQFLNPMWSESYSEGPEILEYINKLAEPIRPKITFGTAVVRTIWKDNLSKWVITLSSGRVLQFDAIIAGTGLLHKLNTPKIPGAELFEGISFHTNQWRNDVSLAGKNIGIIGTGASGVQAVPRIADMGVANLTVFQRTASWVGPRLNFKYSDSAKFLLKHIPGLQRLYRWKIFWTYESRFFIMLMLPSKDIPIIGWLHGKLQSYIHKLVRNYIKNTVKDPDVAKKLTPDFPMGCKRITPSDSYLEAFNKENVHLVTDKIEGINERGIVTMDEKAHDLDVIIYATGFDLLGSVNAFEVSGVDGKSLADDHSDSPRAFYGMTHHLCPNYFMMGGPGIVLGHNTVLFVGECQINYIRCGIEELLLRKASSVCLKESSMDSYQEWSANKMKNKVFEGDKFCTGWYRNSRGVNWTFWPTNLISFWWHTLDFDCENYMFV